MIAPAPISRSRSLILWALALVLMLGAVIYQRRTGPTHPLRGQVTVAGKAVPYRLIRSEETLRDARVALPDPGAPAVLVWRHFPTTEAWTRQAMVLETNDGRAEVAGYLPRQPAAGKVEYRVELDSPGAPVTIPASEHIVLRFKGHVATPLLVSHICMMFIAVLLGLRTALGAAVGPHTPRIHLWVALGCMTLGGLILGPFVQKAAFGAYWTGFPWGYDLTDNKTLLMWLAWAFAAGAAGFSLRAREGWVRVAVMAASVAMTVVYLIPHSLRGSQLDYSKVKPGADARDAVVTGR
jgi:hypothetical protein